MKQKQCAIYVRVSTAGQDVGGQVAELKGYAKNRGWAVTKVYADTISGTTSSRPALDRLLLDARKGAFEIIAIWRLDRLGRSVSNLLQVLETFRKSNIEVCSLSEQFDSNTPSGRLVATVLAGVAEMEREMCVDRIRMGLAHARREGKILGRPALKRLSKTEIDKIRVERRNGLTLRRLSQKYRCSLWAVFQATRS